MSKCNFVCSFPEYVLDRIIIIDDGHEHKISGYKLAKSSEYFRDKLKEIRVKEIEKCKNSDKSSNEHSQHSNENSTNRHKRTKSVNDLEIERITTNFNDKQALEYVLSFIHCQDDLNLPQLILSSDNILPIIKAANELKVPALINHCFEHIKINLNFTNCWKYYLAIDEIFVLNENIYDYIKHFILKNFIEATNSEKFLNIPFEKLQNILLNDSLNCCNEMHLIDIIDKWIGKDKENRKSHYIDLLKSVRLGLLNGKQLEKLFQNESIKNNWNECTNLLTWSQLKIEEITNPINGLSQDTIKTIQYIKKPRYPREAIVVVGGWEGNQDDPNFGPSKALQIYDNRSNIWKRLETDNQALDDGHAYSGCVMINLKIYVVGGYVSAGPTQTLKMFDLVLRKWRYLSPMHEKRNYISATSLDNQIYAIGGHNGRLRLNSVERYDTIHNNWTLIAPMNQVRSDAGSDSLNNKVFVCGGFDGHHFYSSVEMYDPISNQWTEVSRMNNIRSGVSLVAFGDFLYAIGGNDGIQRLRSVEKFDPETNRWQNMPAMIRQRSNFCVTCVENEIYVMGGWSDETNSTIALVEKWEPDVKNEWKPVQQLFLPASANCCCSVAGLEIIQELLK